MTICWKGTSSIVLSEVLGKHVAKVPHASALSLTPFVDSRLGGRIVYGRRFRCIAGDRNMK